MKHILIVAVLAVTSCGRHSESVKGATSGTVSYGPASATFYRGPLFPSGHPPAPELKSVHIYGADNVTIDGPEIHIHNTTCAPGSITINDVVIMDCSKDIDIPANTH